MRRKTIQQQQGLFDVQALKDANSPRGRITISQISFCFQCGLTLTAVRSRNFQKHAERLPCPISFAVPTQNDMVALKRAIRAKALSELARLDNHATHNTSISSIAGFDGDDNLPGIDD